MGKNKNKNKKPVAAAAAAMPLAPSASSVVPAAPTKPSSDKLATIAAMNWEQLSSAYNLAAGGLRDHLADMLNVSMAQMDSAWDQKSVEERSHMLAAKAQGLDKGEFAAMFKLKPVTAEQVSAKLLGSGISLAGSASQKSTAASLSVDDSEGEDDDNLLQATSGLYL
jgi:hypothetical protein